MIAHCNLCASHGPVHAHHLTGRGARRAAYLDPALTIVVCARCHGGAGGFHPFLRTAGLDFPPPGVPLLAHRLRRVAMHAEVIADADRPLTFAPAAARGLAALLREAAAAVGGPR